MPTATFRSAAPVSAEALHDWHARTGAFERLVPPWQTVEVTERTGSTLGDLRVTLRLGRPPFRVGLVAQHRDWVPGGRFTDEQVQGPFARWTHTHRFLPAGGGTSVLEDELDWSLPGWASPASPLVRRVVERTFAFRHARTLSDLARHQGLRPLTLVVAGASGLVGTALLPFLTAGGHTVRRLVRGSAAPVPGVQDHHWDPAAGTLDGAALDGADAVIALSGASIAERWTPQSQALMVSSRLGTAGLLARALAARGASAPALVCASAVGFYGHRDEEVDEDSPPGTLWVSSTCRAWEDACQPARQAGVRVVNARIGTVLHPGGGALQRLLPVFRLGLGGPVGSGRQPFPWIGLDDLLGVLVTCAANPALEGPVNAVSPEPATSASFARALGRALGRPAVLPLPATVVRLAFGQMGQELLLQGARVVPRRLEQAGFTFHQPGLEGALRAVTGGVRWTAEA